MLKVSVVVATYSPGTGLDRLVRSLDAQTLPADEFEVIFVDDGSPDDTVERLGAIAATRPNVRVERIENSGWPSRPRNVGTDLARGEYVLFMDHDDELYPDALRAAVEFARACGSDVVNGKEARTHDPAWALGTYLADSAQDVGREDAHPLVPMNPHKLYRTAFLREHGIRFREGRRVLWEDIFFNVEVAAHAQTISTLASVPFYHWVQTTGSGSTTFLRSDPAWWDHLEQVLESIEQHLGHDTLQGRQLRRHQYGSRILGAFVPAFLRRPESERQLIERRARQLQARFTDVADDLALDRGAQVVAAALRSGDSEVLALAAAAAGTDRFDQPTLVGAEWVDGQLVLRARAATTKRLPNGGTFHLENGRVLAASDDLLDALARVDDDREGARLDVDVAGELDATTAVFTARGRASRIAWTTPGDVAERALRPVAGDEARFELVANGRVDVRAGATPPLDDQVWDLFLRIDRVGRLQQPRLRSAIRALPALVDGRAAVAYTNRDGVLSLDLAGRVASLFDGAAPSEVIGVAAKPNGRCAVSVRLPDVPTVGTGTSRGWVLLSYRRAGIASQLRTLTRRVAGRTHPPARYTVDYEASTSGVVATIELPGPGRYRWSASERDRDADSWELVVREGSADLTTLS